MRQIKTCVILSAAAVLVACASQTPAPATGARTAVAPGTAVAAGQQKSLNIPGYRRVVDNGREMFCRYEATTGSNIKTETCWTRAQVQQQQRDAEQQLQNALQNSRTCTAGYGQGLAGGTCQP